MGNLGRDRRGRHKTLRKLTHRILELPLPEMAWYLTEELGGERVTFSGGAVTIFRQIAG
jgi:hypothetical protein